MQIENSIEIMKSLADSSRLRVLNVLLEKSQYVEELASRLNLAVSTVSFHLKKLEAAGLVFKRKEQYYVVYHVNDEIFNLTLRELTSFTNMEEYIQHERINHYKEKVIKAFTNEGKIVKLPVQQKKRMIILKEIFNCIIPNKKYAETELNEIIKEKYDDYCTVRRELIDCGMLLRENQIYWVNENYKGEKND